MSRVALSDHFADSHCIVALSRLYQRFKLLLTGTIDNVSGNSCDKQHVRFWSILTYAEALKVSEDQYDCGAANLKFPTGGFA